MFSIPKDILGKSHKDLNPIEFTHYVFYNLAFAIKYAICMKTTVEIYNLNTRLYFNTKDLNTQFDSLSIKCKVQQNHEQTSYLSILNASIEWNMLLNGDFSDINSNFMRTLSTNKKKKILKVINKWSLNINPKRATVFLNNMINLLGITLKKNNISIKVNFKYNPISKLFPWKGTEQTSVFKYFYELELLPQFKWNHQGYLLFYISARDKHYIIESKVNTFSVKCVVLGSYNSTIVGTKDLIYQLISSSKRQKK